MKINQSLDADGCLTVERFLYTLLLARKEHGKFNIGKFMQAYLVATKGHRKMDVKPRVWTQDKRKAVIGYLGQGLSLKQIAGILGCKERNIRSGMYNNERFSIKEYKKQKGALN